VNSDKLEAAYDKGILVGWFSVTWIASDKQARVFIPRRDEDILRDTISHARQERLRDLFNI
jgi:hypothetical protein